MLNIPFECELFQQVIVALQFKGLARLFNKNIHHCAVDAPMRLFIYPIYPLRIAYTSSTEVVIVTLIIVTSDNNLNAKIFGQSCEH